MRPPSQLVHVVFRNGHFTKLSEATDIPLSGSLVTEVLPPQGCPTPHPSSPPPAFPLSEGAELPHCPKPKESFLILLYLQDLKNKNKQTKPLSPVDPTAKISPLLALDHLLIFQNVSHKNDGAGSPTELPVGSRRSRSAPCLHPCPTCLAFPFPPLGQALAGTTLTFLHKMSFHCRQQNVNPFAWCTNLFTLLFCSRLSRNCFLSLLRHPYLCISAIPSLLHIPLCPTQYSRHRECATVPDALSPSQKGDTLVTSFI